MSEAVALVEVVPLLGSGSGLYRTLECPAANHLPQTRKRSANAVKAAKRGTGLHDFVQYYAEYKRQGFAEWRALHFARTKVEADKAECERLAKAQLAYYAPGARIEIAMAHNGETGECVILGEGLKRDYQITDQRLTPLTVDAAIPGFRSCEIFDLKTGKTPVPPPAENPQLLHGALCASETIAPQATHFVVGLHTTKGTGKNLRVETEAAVVDRFDLEEYEQQVVRAQKKALRVVQAIEAGEDPEVNPGAHCKYCDAKPACPAWR